MTKERQKQEERTTEERKQIARGSSSTTTTATRSQAFSATPAELEQIRQAYEGCVGGYLTAAIANYITDTIADGVEVPVILDAIQTTGWARRPSPYYLRAILRRYREWGIHTMQDVADDNIERRETQARDGDDAWRAWYLPPRD